MTTLTAGFTFFYYYVFTTHSIGPTDRLYPLHLTTHDTCGFVDDIYVFLTILLSVGHLIFYLLACSGHAIREILLTGSPNPSWTSRGQGIWSLTHPCCVEGRIRIYHADAQKWSLQAASTRVLSAQQGTSLSSQSESFTYNHTSYYTFHHLSQTTVSQTLLFYFCPLSCHIITLYYYYLYFEFPLNFSHSHTLLSTHHRHTSSPVLFHPYPTHPFSYTLCTSPLYALFIFI